MSNNFYGYDELPFEKHRRWISWIVDIVVIVILAFFISDMFFNKVSVSGHSMESVIAQDDSVLIDKMTYKFFKPARNDIVSFYLKDDLNHEQVNIKRIIGLPGETVKIEDGYVYIDGRIIDADNELYKASIAGIAADEIVLDKDEYFVLGDNRAGSEDSRFENIGLVSFEQIDGRVWFRIAPFERIGLLASQIPRSKLRGMP
ncbi:MAG: signal peptidase I [Lachnospiraceae bacterium]|nr:signal peptidase I [Lachnospiraceae bacterium]